MSWRVVLNRLGYDRSRFREDGFAVFTPPEADYDLARARAHILGENGVGAQRSAPLRSETVAAAMRDAWRFPALDWLESTLARLPAGAIKILMLPPHHVASLPPADSAEWQRLERCKGMVRAIASRMRRTFVLDYAHGSSLTRADENFWDTLHYRLPIAARLERDLATVLTSEILSSDDAVSVTTPSPPP